MSYPTHLQVKQTAFADWQTIDYKSAWDEQERIFNDIVNCKTKNRQAELNQQHQFIQTANYLFFCEHTPVFTLGKNGKMNHLLASTEILNQRRISFFQTNRGGDITFHGPQQIVGYPILDLDNFKADIGWYMRSLEEVIILTLLHFNITASRSQGETGVWLDADNPLKARKICAMGVRCSRWVTMHGWALNVNTDLSYFDLIVPCGIKGKAVTSMQKELGYEVDLEKVKKQLQFNFEKVFDTQLIYGI